MSPRFLGRVSYDGSLFSGFQIQPDAPSVQEALQTALGQIEGEKVLIVGAGRTDRGVHAYGQAFHFDSQRSMQPIEFKKALNAHLPSGIYISNVKAVPDDFHARFDAVGKHYQYRLSMAEYNPIEARYVYQYGFTLDTEAINQILPRFLGTHDFTYFCTNHEPTLQYQKTLTQLTLTLEGDKLIFDFFGSGFLRYMVRMLVGNLIEIGRHHLNADEVIQQLDYPREARSPYKAPPEGLYLMNVFYPPLKEANQ